MWIEAITVRTSRPGKCEEILEELAEFRQQKDAPEPEWSACYRNLEVENELSVHLAWEEEAEAPAKTGPGLLIARCFAQYGIVHHTLWKLSKSSFQIPG